MCDQLEKEKTLQVPLFNDTLEEVEFILEYGNLLKRADNQKNDINNYNVEIELHAHSTSTPTSLESNEQSVKAVKKRMSEIFSPIIIKSSPSNLVSPSVGS